MGGVRRWLKGMGRAVLLLPVLLIGLFVLYELFGFCANHAATRRQTDQLQANLEREIPDLEILEVYSETGNTSGTGNHVDCLSSITFSTGLTEAEIKSRLSAYYEYGEWTCFVEQTGERTFRFYLNTSAPFPDNLEGH